MIALLYHDIVPRGDYAGSGFSGRDADIYKFEIEEFVRHLDAIAATGSHATAAVNGNARDEQQGDFVLTFDDGGVGAMIAARLLEERGWRGYFFITTDRIGDRGFLTRGQIRYLHARGHAIGSHSCSHPARMSRCEPKQLEREWTDSLRVLSEICSARIHVASVPGGYFAPCVAETAAEAGITLLFNSEPTTRPTRVGDCTVVGRYSIQHGVSAETAARIACGDWRPRLYQFVFWNTKKIAKNMTGSYYISARKALLNRESKKAA
jgi:peptidoglycan/xylan/chitin deacetylase (PgdA/CDA1 family)